jgi:hypothetical protein
MTINQAFDMLQSGDLSLVDLLKVGESDFPEDLSVAKSKALDLIIQQPLTVAEFLRYNFK